MPIVDADAPNVAWALDFQVDLTVDGKTAPIASMVDEHTRMSLSNIVDRSITADRLIEGSDKAFATWGGSPHVLRMDNGPEFISEAVRAFCAGSVGCPTFHRACRGTTGSPSPSTTGCAAPVGGVRDQLIDCK
ncbi:integrase catalytic domain-containing protein [Rhodococcus sp. IEGM 1366]|uniref:integrase catalytic domain-containing protein n=1 Tax=Rhodococcus sp. IEGM 1366 TaxID=3082223 RepID=UPI003989790F